MYFCSGIENSFMKSKTQYQFTAHIEKDTESSLYVAYVPSLPGAHTQAETLDELQSNLEEVIALCLEELSREEIESPLSQYFGTREVRVAI